MRPGLARGRKGFLPRVSARGRPDESPPPARSPGSPPPPGHPPRRAESPAWRPSYAPCEWEAAWRPRNRALPSARAPGTRRSRSSVAETPPTTGVPVPGETFGGKPGTGPRKAPVTSLRRAPGGLNSRVLGAKRKLDAFWHITGLREVVSQLDEAQAGGTGAEHPGRHDHHGLDQEKARRAIHLADGTSSGHCD